MNGKSIYGFIQGAVKHNKWHSLPADSIIGISLFILFGVYVYFVYM